MKFLLLFFLLIPACCQADEWTKADTAREATYLILHVVDWGQTRNIVHRYQQGEDFWEANPILGKHPSIKRVDSYFSFMMVAHVAVAYVLPRGWREGFQYTTTGLKTGLVISNNSIGLKVDF